MPDPTDSPEEDLKLIEAFIDGNKQAFESLMIKYYKRILNFIYRYVGSREIAEDLTQEVFIRVYNNVHKFKPEAKFSTWAFTIARNLSLNELRRLKRTAFSLDQAVDTQEGSVQSQWADEKAADPGKTLSDDERKTQIRAAISELPENQRVAVLLRRYEDFSYEEIAEAMNTSVKAVKSLLNRAKENLKVKLSNLL